MPFSRSSRTAPLDRDPVRQATITGRPFGRRLGAWAETFFTGTWTAPGTRPAFHSEFSRTSSMVAPLLSISIASVALTEGSVNRSKKPTAENCKRRWERSPTPGLDSRFALCRRGRRTLRA